MAEAGTVRVKVRAETCDPRCETCHPPEVRCAQCDEVIPYATWHGNLDGGSRVLVEGWFGGTVDTFHPRWMTLCDRDTKTFLADNPWLAANNPDLRA